MNKGNLHRGVGKGLKASCGPLWAILCVALLCVPQAAGQSLLSGSFKLPDGTGFTGRLAFALSQQAAISMSSPCTGPALIAPNVPVVVNVVNGAMQSPPTLYSSSCTLPPGIPYLVTATDSTGNVVFRDQWLISGSPFNVGSAQSSAQIPSTSYQGPWQSGHNYGNGDLVSYGTSPMQIYMSLQGNNQGNIPASTTQWQVMGGVSIGTPACSSSFAVDGTTVVSCLSATVTVNGA